MHLLLGEGVDLTIPLFGSDYPSFLVAVLPPGAFIVAGLLIATKNAIDANIERKRAAASTVVKGSKRVRTTGKIA